MLAGRVEDANELVVGDARVGSPVQVAHGQHAAVRGARAPGPEHAAVHAKRCNDGRHVRGKALHRRRQPGCGGGGKNLGIRMGGLRNQGDFV